MESFLFVLTRGLEDPTRVTRALQMAKAAKELDYEVNLFFTDDAVLLAKPGMIDNVVAPTGDEAGGYLTYLIENQVPVYICTPCAVSRQVGESDLIEGSQLSGAPKLFEIAKDSRVFTF